MLGRKIIVAMTVGALWTSAALQAAGRPSKGQALGYVTSQGEVRVDRQAAPSGSSVFAGDVITTGSGAVASVKLVSGAQATLSENGEMRVGSGDAAAPLKLERGAMALRQAGSGAAHVGIGISTIVIQGEPGFAAICRVAYAGGVTHIFADRGRVEVRRKGFSRLVLPGKTYRIEAGQPQAAGQVAGKVTNAIPQGTVQHPGQTNQIDLKVSDPVVWHDTVRTLNTGRVRIGLNDGSILNVGVRSTMRIVKHDAESQQTEIEMQLGRLRGQVVKMSKPGSSFQIKTQTAVIGVVGTILAIHATATNTNVLCIEGRVHVKNLDPNVPGDKTLGPGEQTNVPKGLPPTTPTPASVGQVADELNATNAGEVPTPEFGKFGEIKFPGATTPPPAGLPPSAPPVAPALQIGSLAAGGASAVVGGVAVASANDARDKSAVAAGESAKAGQAADDASAAAADAANAANSLTEGVQNYLDTLSPGGGGCGCLP